MAADADNPLGSMPRDTPTPWPGPLGHDPSTDPPTGPPLGIASDLVPQLAGDIRTNPPTEDRDVFGRRPTKHADWSHRRGEPRYFALLWTVVLMICTGLLFASILVGGVVQPEVYRAAARVSLVTAFIGAMVLWPMVRLSQSRPRHVAPAVFGDLLVVVLPLQAVIWPQQLLAGWPLQTLLLLSLWITGWSLLMGSILAAALALTAPPRIHKPGEGAPARLIGQLLICSLVAGAPGVLALSGQLEIGDEASVAVRDGWMLTPLTGLWEIIRDRSASGAPALAMGGHWAAVRSLFGLAAVCCSVAGLVVLARRKPGE